jgi:hypothetical protein
MITQSIYSLRVQDIASSTKGNYELNNIMVTLHAKISSTKPNHFFAMLSIIKCDCKIKSGEKRSKNT